MIKKIRFVLLLVACFSGTLIYAQQNTILIIADDVSPDYFGCFSTTTDTAITPNISALAERGVRFTKVWSAPVCSPARAGIFTGRYPFRTGVGQIIANALSPQLDTAEMSIAELLRDHAPIPYNTACVGKWHLHANIPPQRLYPNRMGFNFYSGNFNGAINNFYSYPMVVNGMLDSANDYATTQTINDAIGWLDTINTNSPFFLWVAFNAPHTPFHIPPANLCNTSGLVGTPQHINNFPELYFKAAIQAMDTEIGRLVQHLSNNNLLDSTNFIFIGDNGNTSQVAQIANPTKAKGTLYDYGVRVPMIVAGPAVADTNRTCDELINTPDLFATIAELSGFNNWNNSIPPGTVIDSKSFMHLIMNQPGSNRSWIFAEQFRDTINIADGKSIRNHEYHLIRKDIGVEEFYNVALDPEENLNLLNGTMNALEISNYHFLCDTLLALTGIGTCLPLSSEEINLNVDLQIFPNPAYNSFYVKANFDLTSLTIFSIFGNEISTTSSNTMNVETIAPGVYFLRVIFSNGGQTYRTLVISR